MSFHSYVPHRAAESTRDKNSIILVVSVHLSVQSERVAQKSVSSNSINWVRSMFLEMNKSRRRSYFDNTNLFYGRNQSFRVFRRRSSLMFYHMKWWKVSNIEHSQCICVHWNTDNILLVNSILRQDYVSRTSQLTTEIVHRKFSCCGCLAKKLVIQFRPPFINV